MVIVVCFADTLKELMKRMTSDISELMQDRAIVIMEGE